MVNLLPLISHFVTASPQGAKPFALRLFYCGLAFTVPPAFVPFLPLTTAYGGAFSLRLGHHSALTVHRTVIHYRIAASLPQGRGLRGDVGIAPYETYFKFCRKQYISLYCSLPTVHCSLLSAHCPSSHTTNTEISAGETPEIRDACPSERGLIFESFWRASILNPYTSS